MKPSCAFLLFIALSLYKPLYANSFYGESKRGWFWFESKSEESNQEKSQKPDPLVRLNAFQNEIESRKAAMIMSPSLENTRAYIQLQNEMFAKASLVNQNWQKALVLYPELNIVKDKPISETGMAISRKLEEQNVSQQLKDFSKEFSLLFFYKADCPYCEQFADVVEHFSQKHGYKVASVTLDGKQLKRFRGVYDPNLIQKLKITFTPALFAFSNTRGVIVPIAQGFLPIDLLERNVLVARKIVEAQHA
jgi:conjugal transfer pilus assembly protein TraF